MRSLEREVKLEMKDRGMLDEKVIPIPEIKESLGLDKFGRERCAILERYKA